MNKSPKNIITIPTGNIPVNNADLSQEGNNLFDVRFSQNNFFLGYQQDMPTSRKITVRQTMTQVKKSLGFRPMTHYKTMLQNPSSKLLQFIYPDMKVEDLKALAKILSTSDPKQRTQLKK